MTASHVRRPLGSLRLACLGTLLLIALLPTPGFGQSAADKSSARQLAVEGINLYKEGSYQPALERLERAQALYDAHVHLVYIARCQVKLGKLVEASEAYRALARKPLPPDASDVVKNSKAEGAEELAKLEPRIPSLRVQVEPQDAKGLELTINGEAVPAAAIGVDRPVNPGKVVVRVGGDGWKPSEATVDVPEAAKQAVTLKLEPGPKSTAAAAPGASAAGAGTAPSGAQPTGEPELGILLGLRLGVTAPFGKLEVSAPPPLQEVKTAKVSDLFDAGSGLEARLGFRFMQRFTGLVSAEGYLFRPRPRGDGWQFDEIGLAVEGAENAESQPVGYRVGVGLMYTRVGPGIDWFAEGALAYQGIRSDTRVTREVLPACTRTTELSGAVVKATGGVVFPIARVFSIHPFGGFSLGSFTDGAISGDCGAAVELAVEGVQGWVTLGVGGDFVIPVGG